MQALFFNETQNHMCMGSRDANVGVLPVVVVIGIFRWHQLGGGNGHQIQLP